MPRLPRVAKPIPDAEARWASLHAKVPPALRQTDGTRIDVFVHLWTQRELLLGDDGAVFCLTPARRYKVVDAPEWAVERVLPHRWEWLEMGGFEPIDPLDRWVEDEEPAWDPSEDLAF